MNEMRELTAAELDAVGGASFMGGLCRFGMCVLAGGGIGSEICPGAGTVIGALVGAVVGVVAATTEG